MSETLIKNSLKILVVGLGSMGKRRIRNLQHLNQNDVIGFDPRDDRCKESFENMELILLMILHLHLKKNQMS